VELILEHSYPEVGLVDVLLVDLPAEQALLDGTLLVHDVLHEVSLALLERLPVEGLHLVLREIEVLQHLELLGQRLFLLQGLIEQGLLEVAGDLTRLLILKFELEDAFVRVRQLVEGIAELDRNATGEVSPVTFYSEE